MAEDLDARLTDYVAARFLVAFGVDEVTIVQVHSVVPGEQVRILKPLGSALARVRPDRVGQS